ncbi:hypothetical protein ZIOFF_062296 [Zingiber officinale]|uniref:Uncharacterized protein n=1 Tax=Zingiber officinale TaxID=94328 RepID=A0A8J5F0W6_ZINOF|nr:hypothetical protein ZIOFF_062296 [Zingiber officinale]
MKGKGCSSSRNHRETRGTVEIAAAPLFSGFLRRWPPRSAFVVRSHHQGQKQRLLSPSLSSPERATGDRGPPPPPLHCIIVLLIALAILPLAWHLLHYRLGSLGIAAISRYATAIPAIRVTLYRGFSNLILISRAIQPFAIDLSSQSDLHLLRLDSSGRLVIRRGCSSSRNHRETRGTVEIAAAPLFSGFLRRWPPRSAFVVRSHHQGQKQRLLSPSLSSPERATGDRGPPPPSSSSQRGRLQRSPLSSAVTIAGLQRLPPLAPLAAATVAAVSGHQCHRPVQPRPALSPPAAAPVIYSDCRRLHPPSSRRPCKLVTCFGIKDLGLFPSCHVRWVEGMTPIFSRSAWHCVWHLIQVPHGAIPKLKKCTIHVFTGQNNPKLSG